jgi:hypothetical protein
VANQFIALLRAPSSCFERYRFFNTGGDTVTMRELGDVVRGIIPEAEIEVTPSEEKDLAGLAASVSDQSMEEIVGYKRQYAPIEAGVRAHMNVVRAKEGLDPL